MKSFQLPTPVEVYNINKERVIGKYVHFGLENALMGKSAGIYFRHADVIQYAGIYATRPELINDEIMKKVYLVLEILIIQSVIRIDRF